MTSTVKAHSRPDELANLHEIVDGIIGLRSRNTSAKEYLLEKKDVKPALEQNAFVEEPATRTNTMPSDNVTKSTRVLEPNNNSSKQNTSAKRHISPSTTSRVSTNNNDNNDEKRKVQHVTICEPVTNSDAENTPLTRWRRSHSANRAITASLSPMTTVQQSNMNETSKWPEVIHVIKTQLRILTVEHNYKTALHSVSVNSSNDLISIATMMQTALMQDEKGKRAMYEYEELDKRLRLFLSFNTTNNTLKEMHVIRARTEPSVLSAINSPEGVKLKHNHNNNENNNFSNQSHVTNDGSNKWNAEKEVSVMPHAQCTNNHQAKQYHDKLTKENTIRNTDKRQQKENLLAEQHAMLILLARERQQRWTITSHEASDYYKIITRTDQMVKKSLSELKLKVNCKLPL